MFGLRLHRSSKLDLSHDVKLSCNMGQLVPTLCHPVNPGERFSAAIDTLVRFSPLIAPLMHKVDVSHHYFFVPNRLVWKEFQDFITTGLKGDKSPIHPFIVAPPSGGFPQSSLGDYLGIAIGKSAKVDATPFRAYAQIINDWYIQQDLQELIVFSTDSGDDSANFEKYNTVFKRNWNRDYFTTCLPYPQKGPATLLPLGGEAPVKGIGVLIRGAPNNNSFSGTAGTVVDSLATASNTSNVTYDTYAEMVGQGNNSTIAMEAKPGTVNGASAIPYVRADLGANTAINVNELRLAFQTQRFAELNARYGSRYVEFLYSHFGVKSPDARLQRSEYLGSYRAPVVFSEVLQTAPSGTGTAATPLANLAGHGYSSSSKRVFKRTFLEHGWLFCLTSVMPVTAYQQGLPRYFTRFSLFDYLLPTFVNIGEQGVLNKEIFLSGQDAQDEALFGYQARYEEYRHVPSRVCGDFQTTNNFWHLGRIFQNAPVLNDSFLQCDPSNRIFAVTDSAVSKLYMHIGHNITAVRPLPKVAHPGYIDH